MRVNPSDVDPDSDLNGNKKGTNVNNSDDATGNETDNQQEISNIVLKVNEKTVRESRDVDCQTEEFDRDITQHPSVNADSANGSMECNVLGVPPITSVPPTDSENKSDIPVTDGSEGGLLTMQFGNSSLLRLDLELEGVSIAAAVDTAAEVTIISDKIYESLKERPPTLRESYMHAAGRGMRMKTCVVGPVNLRIGSKLFKTEVYVAPIQDDMLLGLNFMVTYGVTVDLAKLTFNIGGETLCIAQGPKQTIPVVSRVMVDKRTVIQPNSVAHVDVKLESPLESYVVEPCNTKVPLLIPRCLYSTQMNPRICLVNASDGYYTLKPGTWIATAEQVENVENGIYVNKVVETEELTSSELPSHLHSLLEKSSENLSCAQREKLRLLMNSFADIFSKDEYDLGLFKGIEHSIDTENARPVKQRMRRTPTQFIGEEEQHLEKMAKADVMEPSVSEWASPPVLIRKSDGKVRYAIDYRKLNAVTKKDVYPLPLIEECLDTLAGNEWFSKLDANSAYWQIQVKKEDRPKTAFITKYGLFQFKRMSFGLCNAPATYARAMDLLLRGLTWQIVLCFLDDILVMGKNFDDHLENLKAVFERFREHGIKLKPQKCDLCKAEVSFLGRTVNKSGMAIGDEYVEAVKRWKTPGNTKEVEQFLGFVNYHRTFIRHYSKIASPLTKITGKKPFHWGPEQQQAFDSLKTALQSTPLLTLPNSHDKFILDTDASDVAIGAELLQIQDGVEKVIAYGSFSLSSAQRRYCTTRKELLAIVRFTQHFRHYLLGREFLVRTDHNSLLWLMNFKEPQGQLARWLEVLSQYNHMKIQHRPGKSHTNADVLSRYSIDQPCPEMSIFVKPENLPCGGCKHCVRVHAQWQDFVEIDNVVPLSSTPVNTGDNASQKERPIPQEDTKAVEEESKGVLANTVSVNDNDGYGIQYTTQQLCTEQSKDPDLQLILFYLQNKENPPENEVYIAGPAAKKYLVNKEQFFLNEDSVLCNKAKNDLVRLVIPKTYSEEVLKLNHDIPVTGHQGIDRTTARIKKKFYWYKMGDTIKSYIRSCNICNEHKKASRKARCPLTQYHAGAPMERVHIDFLGPLPETSSGNTNILVMIDQFTKWVEIVPLPSQTAEVTAKAAVNEFFTRFGCPFSIHSDQGRNFESQLFKSLCETFKIYKTRTTPYRPSANGQVERVNRTLMDAVRCFVSKTQKDWDEFLPQLACALRSSVNRMTGLTPNQMMLGREVNLPSDLVFRPPRNEVQENEQDYVDRLKEAMHQAHEVARENLKTNQKHMKRDYDLRMRKNEFKPGDLVYVLDMAHVKGRNKKLDPPWKGPGIVAEKITSYVYKIKMEKRVVVLNHDRLKKCYNRMIPKWLKRDKNRIRDGETILDQNDDIYCLCRKGYQEGEFMIGCDSCDEWYHGPCVGITPEFADTLRFYECPRCQRK